MDIVIGLIIVASIALVTYWLFNRNEEVVTEAQTPVKEPVIEAAQLAVVQVAETHSVEVQNTEVEVAPVKKAKVKVRAKTTKPKKTKIQVAK